MLESSATNDFESTDPDGSLLQGVIRSQVKDWMRGERNSVDYYLDHNPDLRQRPSAILDLIYQEVALRELAGESPRAEDYQGRYGELVDSISRLFEVHQGMSTLSLRMGPQDRSTRLDDRATLGTIPGYDLEGTLGQGGMGVVYLARHRGLNRRVALKMLHSGSRARPEQRSRFLREAEAVAKCQHPNLVQIFEVGEHAGSPFLALEYVAGGNLAQSLAGLPQTPRKAAWLVEILARAIDHAHQKGVVHRDLKPSNVLMTAEGAPKITDFGLAKLLDDEATRTEDGAILGTVSYMAPEQASGGSTTVGPAADIYALGAILYECLTGRPPFQEPVMLAALERVRTEPPIPPSRLGAKLPSDLETICLKCLEKAPSQRYDSAAALADDLQRFLESRTILARRASPIEKAIRWSRRNVWASAFMMLLTLAVVFSGSLAFWAVRAENSARISAKEAVNRAEITEAVDQFVRKDLLSQASSFNQSLGNIPPDPDLKVRTALDRAAATIDKRFVGRPRVEAAIQHTIGETYLELGLFEDARRHLERALALRQQELGESHPETLAAMLTLGMMYQANWKLDDAKKYLVPALKGLREVVGPKNSDTLSAMVAVAELDYNQERYEDSERLFFEALSGFRKLKGENDPRTLQVMSDLANIFCGLRKNLDEAKRMMDHVIAISETQDGPDHPQTLLAKANLSIVYATMGKNEEAHRINEEILPKLKRVLGASHPSTLGTMALQGELAIRLGKYREAEPLLLEALKASRTQLDREHMVTDVILANLASLYSFTKEFNKIEPVLKEALDITRSRMGPDHDLTAGGNKALASYYMAFKRYAEAEPYLREVLRFEAMRKPQDVRLFDAQNWLGGCLVAEGKLKEAEKLMLASYKGMRASQSDTSPERKAGYKALLENLIQLYERLDNPKQVEEWRTRLRTWELRNKSA